MISQMKQIPCGVHFIRVIRVISVQKKEIYLRFIDLREVMSPRITCITGKIRFSIVLYKKVSDDPERRKLIPQLQMLNICSFTQLWMGFYAT